MNDKDTGPAATREGNCGPGAVNQESLAKLRQRLAGLSYGTVWPQELWPDVLSLGLHARTVRMRHG